MQDNNKVSFSYGKREATIMSGIALILMFMHHMFVVGWLLPENVYQSILTIGGENIEEVVGRFCKICVSVFAFNTGYAMWVKAESYRFSHYTLIIKRLLIFLCSYWLIYLLYIIYGYFANEELPSLSIFLGTLVGRYCGKDVSYINVTYAWYVYFYIVIILLSPLIIKLFKNGGGLQSVLKLITIATILYFTAKISSDIKFILGGLPIYICPTLIGVICAKHDLFNKVSLNIHTVTLILSLFLIFVIRPVLYRYIGPYVDAILIMPFIYTTMCLVNLFISKLPSAENILLLIGVNSMNMWFLHGIFHTGEMKLQYILYCPKFSFLIIIWGIVMLLPIAMLCSRIQSFITKKIRLQ